MRNPLTIWLVCDGKSGHESQSLGLAEAIGRLTPVSIHPVRIAGASGFPGRIRAGLAASAGLPVPDLVIAAGHATHPSLLLLTRRNDAFCVVLMRPSLPLSWFDLCIAPEHDFPAGNPRANVVLTRGALHRVTHGEGARDGKLILVGGPSKTHGWDGTALLDALAPATDGGGWELSDSRRTPAGFLDEVRSRLPGIRVFPHQETPDGWVAEKLQRAQEVWVTEDSVSMIHEALASGARVGLLPMPRVNPNSRVVHGIGRLVADGYLTPHARWLETRNIPPPPAILREADRCAELVLARLAADGS